MIPYRAPFIRDHEGRYVYCPIRPDGWQATSLTEPTGEEGNRLHRMFYDELVAAWTPVPTRSLWQRLVRTLKPKQAA